MFRKYEYLFILLGVIVWGCGSNDDNTPSDRPYLISGPVDEGGIFNIDVGSESSIAIDRFGITHISYYDAGGGDLKYVRNGRGPNNYKSAFRDLSRISMADRSWIIEIVDQGAAAELDGDVGRKSSLAIDALGRPHILYYDDTFARLKYAAKDGDEWKWSLRVIDETAGEIDSCCSLSLDRNDEAHFIYGNRTFGRVQYGIYDFYEQPEMEAVFTAVELRPNAERGPGCQTAGTLELLATSDSPVLAYHDCYRSTTALVTSGKDGFEYDYLSPATGSVAQEGRAPGRWLAVEVDRIGAIHLLYLDNGYSDLVYARIAGGERTFETIRSGCEISGYADLALVYRRDADNAPIPVAAYHDENAVGLSAYWRKGEGRWGEVVIESGSGSGRGVRAAAYRDQPIAAFSYYNPTRTALMAAYIEF